MRRFTAALFLFCMCMTAACSTDDHPAQHSSSSAPTAPMGWPQSLGDFSIVWSAEPGIDLDVAPITAIRAYIESYRLVYLTSNSSYLYPGFSKSVDQNDPNHPGTRSLWPYSHPPGASRSYNWIGTERDHILSVDRTEQGVKVIVCHYFYGSAAQGENGEYEANMNYPFDETGGIDASRITLTPPIDPPQLPPQTGPARAPLQDVFDGWRITSQEGPFAVQDSDWPDYQRDKTTCIGKAPDSPERRIFLNGRAHRDRSDFPTLPPYPGWPA